MKVLGVGTNQFVKIGAISILAILLFKLVAAKSGIQGLQTVAVKI